MRQNRIKRKNAQSRSSLVVAESLEIRRFLSAVLQPQAVPVDGVSPQTLSRPGSATPTGFSPAQITNAYGINSISFGGVTGTGAGQTIAIVVAHDNPTFVDTGSAGFATSDLHNFDVAMGLPDPPSFTKVDDNGGTSYPSTDPGWANEIALDVEWTHALAPQANILLIECESTNPSVLIESGVQYATEVPGVSVVTMSFAVTESMADPSFDSFLESPTGHGITFIAASGDSGNNVQYPASSPNVLAVGATSLTLSGSNYSSETGWNAGDGVNSSGGGISSYESKPSYQFGVTQSSTLRTVPDVSFDGDPQTGVSVYDSFNGGSSTPWYKVGGTSFSAPAWAALIAIANQGRAHLGLGSLDGVTQTLPRLYSLPSSDFHDITTGNNNGNSAGPGYDLVTGLGTPIANRLVPDLAGGNTVTGTVFVDSNGNGSQDSGETGLAGVSVFTDIYHTGIFEGADQEITSTTNGTYSLGDLPGGTYRIAATTPAGYALTTSNNLTATGTLGSTTTGKDFGYKATNIPAKLEFNQQASSATAGTVITPAITVDVDDASGNLVASDNSLVTLSISSGSATLGGTVSVHAVNGVATFSNVTLSISGNDILQASDGSLTSTTSNSITVVGDINPPAGAVLVFSQQPTNTSSGSAITPAIVVDVENSSGSIITSDGSSVTLTVATGPNGATGTETAAAVNGVATFSDVNFTVPGSYNLNASDGTLTPVTSSAFTILDNPGQLAFGQLPTSANAGEALIPAITVDVLDGSGTLVSTDSSPVTIAIATGPGTLAGTLTQNAVNGVATFGDLVFSTPGAYTLTATDGSLTTATSSTLTVKVPGTITPALVKNTLATSLVAGSKVHAAVVVNESNIAANNSTGMVTTQLFATIDGSQTLLSTLTRKMTVKAKKNYVVSLPINSIPSGLSGIYTLQLEVTDTSGLTQTISGPNVTIAAPFTSLTETVTKLTLPSSVVGGAKTKAIAVVKITNVGNVTSTGLTTTRIYLSADGTINTGELVNAISRSLAIKAGGSALVTVPLILIPATLSGNLDVLAEVTDPNAIRTFANTGTQVTVGAPFVHLSATIAAPLPATVSPGKSFSVVITLLNTGNISTTGLASINLGLSANGVTELAGSIILSRPVTIAAGKSATLRLKFPVPTSLAAGQYFPYLMFNQLGNSAVAVGTIAVTVG